jgi:hypothetical protein
MKDDYLWDRGGEPDAEVAEFEETLGVLRYQPRPFEFPLDARAPRNVFASVGRGLAPRLAIAAAFALALLALGVWLGMQSWPRSPAIARDAATSAPVTMPEFVAHVPTAAASDSSGSDVAVVPAVEPKLHESYRRVNPTPAVTQQREALVAKDQLMLALRLASAKLNLAQKKTLNINPRDPLQNQRKIG